MSKTDSLKYIFLSKEGRHPAFHYLCGTLTLLLLHLLEVEFKLTALENISIAATALAGATGNASVDTTYGKLIVKMRIKFAAIVALFKLSLKMVALLALGFLSGSSAALLLDTDLNTIVLLIPLLERGSINLHNSILYQSLSTHKFVVGGVINDIQHTGLTGNSLRTPRKVTVVKTESTELGVSSADANRANADIRGELGHSRLAAELIPETQKEEES